MDTNAQPHAPRCVQCGRLKHTPRPDAAPSAWCDLCERKRVRRARQMGAEWKDALRRGDTWTRDSIARSLVRLTTIN